MKLFSCDVEDIYRLVYPKISVYAKAYPEPFLIKGTIFISDFADDY